MESRPRPWRSGARRPDWTSWNCPPIASPSAYPDDEAAAYRQGEVHAGHRRLPAIQGARLQPIAPSADWRVDLAEGCPAHCAYCYLAGSLKGPPVTRAWANLPEIEAAVAERLGQGTITSRSRHRTHEGTTYEASCYTDPLGIEHLTGSLARLIEWFGGWTPTRSCASRASSRPWSRSWRWITAAGCGCAPA